MGQCASLARHMEHMVLADHRANGTCTRMVDYCDDRVLRIRQLFGAERVLFDDADTKGGSASAVLRVLVGIDSIHFGRQWLVWNFHGLHTRDHVRLVADANVVDRKDRRILACCGNIALGPDGHRVLSVAHGDTIGFSS